MVVRAARTCRSIASRRSAVTLWRCRAESRSRSITPAPSCGLLAARGRDTTAFPVTLAAKATATFTADSKEWAGRDLMVNDETEVTGS